MHIYIPTYISERRQEAQAHTWATSLWCTFIHWDHIPKRPKVTSLQKLKTVNTREWRFVPYALCCQLQSVSRAAIKHMLGTITGPIAGELLPLMWRISISGSLGCSLSGWEVSQGCNPFPGTDLPSVEVDLFCHLQWGPLHVPGAPHNLCANSHDILCVSL